MNFRWAYLLDAFIIIAALGLVGYVLWSVNVPHLIADGTCSRKGKVHEVSLAHDKFSTDNLIAKQCDELKVTNNDSQDYELAFGPHDHHLAYPGFEETLLRPSDSATITLSKEGIFPLHDHNRDHAILSITVTPF